MDRHDPYSEISAKLDALYLESRPTMPGPPPRLFHYTDSQGLIGIVVDQRLWASNADFLNDSSEPAYALDVLKTSFNEVERCLRSSGAAQRALTSFWDWAMDEYEGQGPHIYVFCLSECDDLLSQWRAYGGHGAGYAIGFSAPGLCSLLRPSEGQYLVKIVYDRAQQEEEAKSAFNQIVSVVEQFEHKHGRIDAGTCGPDADLVDRRVRSAFLSELIRLRGRFKTLAFREEKEWRLIQFVPPALGRPPIRFRHSIDAIKPYLELDLGANRLPIEQVTIGPALKPELSRRSIMLMFAEKGWSNVDVRGSGVPFRL
jgi:hypothetical protein